MPNRIDLITGFLGAGKTTFILQYTRWLSRRGIPYVVIENEFGQVAADSAFLKQDGTQVVELSGGCICCGLKVKFHDLLLRLADQPFRIIVEPSGIFNPHDFFDIVDSPRVKERRSPGAVVCIVDPNQLAALADQDRDILAEQLNCSGHGLLSKTANMSDEALGEAMERVFALYDNPDVAQLETRPWNLLTDADYERISTPMINRLPRDRKFWDHTGIFNTVILCRSEPCALDDAEKTVRAMFDSSHGLVRRIKGHLRCAGGGAIQINCTPENHHFAQVESQAKPLINIIGRDLDRKALDELLKGIKQA